MKFFTLVAFLFFSPVLFAQTVVRDIRSFGAKGDGKTNDHEAFQRAAAFFNQRGGNGKLVISKGVYIVGKQVFNRNTAKEVFQGSDLLGFINAKNLSIEGQNGAVIRYAAGLRFGAFDPQSGQPYLHGNNFFSNNAYKAFVGYAISLNNCSNVRISNLELNGNSNELILGGVYGDVGIQLPHTGVFILNSTDIVVKNVNAHHFGQDGIMVMNSTGNNTSPDKIVLSNSRFEYNSRQGLSWVGGNDLTASDCEFNHTGRGKFASPPSAGVDIEAEAGPIRNGKFVRCEFVDNTGCGLVADQGNSSNCTFTDCTFWGITSWSVWINKPGFRIVDSHIYGSIVHGYDSDNDADATVYQHCLFEDKPYNGTEPFGYFLIETNNRRRMRFEDCTMIAHKKRLLWMSGNLSWKPEEKYQLVNCKLTFLGEEPPKDEWVTLTRSVRYKDCTFELNHPDAEKNRYYFNSIAEHYNIDEGGNKFYINKKELKSLIRPTH